MLGREQDLRLEEAGAFGTEAAFVVRTGMAGLAPAEDDRLGRDDRFAGRQVEEGVPEGPGETKRTAPGEDHGWANSPNSRFAAAT